MSWEKGELLSFYFNPVVFGKETDHQTAQERVRERKKKTKTKTEENQTPERCCILSLQICARPVHSFLPCWPAEETVSEFEAAYSRSHGYQ